jgi:ABC-2 type transport system permease protein
MTAFVTHFAFEFRTGIRNRGLLFLTYLFPLIFFLMMGFIMPPLNPMFLEGFVPAMVTFAVLAAAMLGIPDPLVNARESGIFRSYKINGVPAASILGIPCMSTTLHLVVVSIIMIVLSPLLFKAPLPTNWLAFAGTFLLFAFACAGLAALIGVVSPSSRTTILLTQLIFIPSMLLGGLMIPFNVLPASAQRLSLLLPTTYAMNLFRGPAMGETPSFSPALSIAVLLAGGVLAFVLALFLFSWDRRNAGRRGHPALALLALAPYVLGLLMA